MPETDRELLELAAKAAGIEIGDWFDSAEAYLERRGQWWNPLTDDGDVMRLAVDLGMNLYINEKYCIAEILSDSESPPIHKKEYCDIETKNAANRRAIVRAAAEIGKEMR